MSLTKRFLESQSTFQLAPANLETARREVNHVRRVLDSIENLSELDFDGIATMSRSLAHAENLLTVTQSQLDQACFSVKS